MKKYMRIIYSQYYNEEIVGEYLKTYVNARYYNIQNTEKPDDSSETDQTESKQSIIILSVLIVIALIGFGFIVAKKSKK